MIDPLSSPQIVKEYIGSLVSWGHRLPDYVFTRGGYPYVYFFESSITGRPELLSCLATVLLRTFSGPAMFSIAHDGRDGRFSGSDASATLLVCDQGNNFFESAENRAFFDFIAAHPYTGLACGANPFLDWMLFEDPTDLVGVLVANNRIDLSESEIDYIFDFSRFVRLAAAPELDFSDEFIKKIRKAYGSCSVEF